MLSENWYTKLVYHCRMITSMPNAGRAWTMLGLGVAAQTAGTVFVSAPAFLIPLLHTERGLSLAEAGLLAGAPTIGMVLTLIAWGALADRIGERWVIAGGLALTALATIGAIAAQAYAAQGYVALGILFLLGGMASASTNAASGRVVVGWFPKNRRGFAMGIRQTCQPLGVMIAAVTIPPIAAGSGVGAALALPLVMTAVLAVACAIAIRNPPRGQKGVDAAPVAQLNPYRASGFLWRIHAVSALLVVPQFTLSIFGLVWLVTELRWSPLAAGVLVGLSQAVGAICRIGVGILSDRIGSRVRPLRWAAVAATLCLLTLAAFDAAAHNDAGWGAAAVIFVIATTATVVDNGLAFTSVAEMAGPAWAGRALGAQNTGQFLVASAVGPAMGALIGAVGYPIAFAVAALLPAAALPLIPRGDAERDRL